MIEIRVCKTQVLLSLMMSGTHCDVEAGWPLQHGNTSWTSGFKIDLAQRVLLQCSTIATASTNQIQGKYLRKRHTGMNQKTTQIQYFIWCY